MCGSLVSQISTRTGRRIMHHRVQEVPLPGLGRTGRLEQSTELTPSRATDPINCANFGKCN